MKELLDQVDRRQLVLLMGGLVLLIVVAIGNYLVAPEVKKYRKEVRSLEVIEGMMRNRRDASSEIADLSRQIETIRKEIHGELPEMPLKQLEAFIMGQLQKISWQNNVELNNVKPGFNQSILIFQEISLSVDVSGQYFDIHRWMWSLSQELGFMVIKQFDINPIGFVEKDPPLKLQMNIVFYREADK